MSTHKAALASFMHHQVTRSWKATLLSLRKMLGLAFRAGWDMAGGDERLTAIEHMQVSVSKCCGEKAGDQFCESFGCATLNKIRKILGDSEVDE